MDLLRVYPRSQRYIHRTQRQDRNRNCYLCQVSKLTGLEGITPGRNIELDPTLTAERNDVRDDLASGDLEEGDVDVEPGLTARWGMTPNLTLNAAINPDFYQVEADVEGGEPAPARRPKPRPRPVQPPPEELPPETSPESVD